MSNYRWFIGLDLGQAADPSALAAIEETTDLNGVKWYGVRHLQRWELGTGYPKVVDDTLNVVNRLPPVGEPVLCIDNTGVGRAVVDMFRLKRDKLNARIVPITITGGHKAIQQGQEWHVPKKDLVGAMQVLLGTRRFQVANLPLRSILLKELTTFKMKMNKETGNTSFEAWRTKEHDDVVLSCAIAAWYALKGGQPPSIGQFRILPDRLAGKKKPPLRVVLCDYRELAKLEIAHNCLLVCLGDPGSDPPQANSLHQLADHPLILQFANLNPDDVREQWAEPLPPWGKTPDQLVMTNRDGNRLWGFLNKKREPPVEVVVVADDDRGRSLSLAMGIVEAMGTASVTMVKVEDMDWKQGKDDRPPNPHIARITKQSKGAVP